MQREVMWSAWNVAGAEHLLLQVGQNGIVADGLVIGVAERERPFRICYEVRCDADWGARAVQVSVPGSDPAPPAIDLTADGRGNWTTSSGEPVTELEGCVDVDISVTPFTNTLPIRRLRLDTGKSVELPVAYVDVDKMRTWTEKQRYTRLESNGDGLYKYESLDGGFTANLPVDPDGLVLDYPGLFKRILF